MDTRLSNEDPVSYSNPELARVTNIHLNLVVNFDRKQLLGYVDLCVEKQADSADVLVLDTKDLDIQSVVDKETGGSIQYVLGDPFKAFGSKLTIQLPNSTEKRIDVRIHYATSQNASALQWLTPEQTAGKKHPYLFSQCQAIHARTMVPCQDTSFVKFTYTAEISAPPDLTVLMSAIKQDSSSLNSDQTMKVHTFLQTVPIPSYLIALVVGDIVSRKIGPRSHVWTEQEMIEAAAYEFAETENMLATAEALLGEYEWGIYDLLVLPPSFPYGGMENPCLTFVTPTLLAGDRSLADVVAHEISHSWTGNLVTNKNPEHFWLNEGHTVFVERKISGLLHGGEAMRHFKFIGGWKDLQYAVGVYGEDSPMTHLTPDLTGPIDPDDAFSSVPYEKGSCFLFYLEQIVGGPKEFEPFLRAYIKKFSRQSITTEQWKEFLLSFFSDKVNEGVFNSVDWEKWFNSPGMPPVKPEYDTSLIDVSKSLSKRWVLAGDDAGDFSKTDISIMVSAQVIQFLAELLQEEPLSAAKIKKMEELYGFNKIRNSEIRFRWIRLGLRAKYEPAIKSALEFINEQGRMKFVRPIYRDLYAWNMSQDVAVQNFNEHKKEMHSITASMVSKDLKV